MPTAAEATPTTRQHWFAQFLNGPHTWGPTFARVTLGVVILPHGLQKATGAFDGPGFSATMEHLSTDMGVPGLVAFAVIMFESLGALALILGLLSRFVAVGIAGVMLGAVVMVHAQYGFFMNWQGEKAGEGLEYHLLALGLALVVIVSGGGKLALDRAWLDQLHSGTGDSPHSGTGDSPLSPTGDLP